MSPAPLQFWFGLGSTYTYLSVMRIEAAARLAGVQVEWKPFKVASVMKRRGAPAGPFLERPEKLAYMWRDLARRAARHGLAFAGPQPYPVDSRSADSVCMLAAMEGWCAPYSRELLRMHFVHGRTIGVPGNLEAALSAIGMPPAATIARAGVPAITDALDANTEQAMRAGLFGSPSFIVCGELFWGDDRLDDALAWALRPADSC